MENPEYNNNEITIFDSEMIEVSDDETLQEAGIGESISSVKKILLRPRRIAKDKIKNEIKDFLLKSQTILSECSMQYPGYEMNTIEIQAQITSSGQIGLMGTNVGITGTGNIKFIFKRMGSN
jgi:hypothetical protein